MLKKILIVFAVFSALTPPAFSQQGPAKVLVTVHAGLDDIFGFAAAVSRALELKKGGVNVRVVFEGESVLYFLGKDFTSADPSPSPPPPPPDPSLPRGELVPGDSTSTVIYSTFTAVLRPPEIATPGKVLSPHTQRSAFDAGSAEIDKAFLALMEEFKAAEIPYTLCSFSANFLGKYDKLKKLGLPLSKDPAKIVGISAYIKDGYQVIGY